MNSRPTENSGVPGLFGSDPQAESVSAQVVLAEGEELSSNPLSCDCNELRTTQVAVDVDRRIFGAAVAIATSCKRRWQVPGSDKAAFWVGRITRTIEIAAAIAARRLATIPHPKRMTTRAGSAGGGSSLHPGCAA